tara:strand:- start:2888 stop:3241 length:354 start_codon:yes stop_codon:yes gene_type:complete
MLSHELHIIWITSDGKKFIDEKEARQWEGILGMVKNSALPNMYESSLRSRSSKSNRKRKQSKKEDLERLDSSIVVYRAPQRKARPWHTRIRKKIQQIQVKLMERCDDAITRIFRIEG